MASLTELDVMKSIDEALSGITDPATRDRILKWVWAKFSPIRQVAPEDGKIDVSRKERIPKKKTSKKTTKGKSSLTIVKDLNLRPSGKKSLEEFVKAKSPSSDRQKCVVCVYYVLNELKQGPVSTDHVYTCFKSLNWRIPSSLENVLQWVASQKGWLDTYKMSDIKLTTHGENLVEHDLPPKNKKETK